MTFRTFSGLKKHAFKCNSQQEQTIELNTNNSQLVDPSKTTYLSSNYLSPPKLNVDVDDENLANEQVVSNFIANINSLGIAESTITKIMEYSYNLVHCITTKYISLVDNSNTEIDQSSVLFHMKKISFSYKACFDKVGSKYKREKNFESSKFYVKPRSIVISTRWDRKYCTKSKSYKKCLIQNFFQYIPILSTIEALFSNTSFHDLYFQKQTCMYP